MATREPGLPAHQCHLIEGVFAYTVQLLLFVVAMSALFFKRQFCDTTHRPVLVWALDCTKQSCGALVIHCTNILASLLLANARVRVHGHSHADECAWYFINFVVDCFVGVFIAWLLLRGSQALARRQQWEALEETGNYGDPPLLRWWLAQTAVWVLICAVNKGVLTLGVLPLALPLSKFGIWLFSGLEPHPNTELLFVMVLAPAVLNVVQYWIFDNLLMAHSARSPEKPLRPTPSPRPGEEGRDGIGPPKGDPEHVFLPPQSPLAEPATAAPTIGAAGPSAFATPRAASEAEEAGESTALLAGPAPTTYSLN